MPCWKLVGEGKDCHLEGKEVEADVVTIHLLTRKMRVRFYNEAQGKFQSRDISIDEFDKNYQIIAR
jgi:hypothetical protein